MDPPICNDCYAVKVVAMIALAIMATNCIFWGQLPKSPLNHGMPLLRDIPQSHWMYQNRKSGTIAPIGGSTALISPAIMAMGIQSLISEIHRHHSGQLCNTICNGCSPHPPAKLPMATGWTQIMVHGC